MIFKQINFKQTMGSTMTDAEFLVGLATLKGNPGKAWEEFKNLRTYVPNWSRVPDRNITYCTTCGKKCYMVKTCYECFLKKEIAQDQKAKGSKASVVVTRLHSFQASEKEIHEALEEARSI